MKRSYLPKVDRLEDRWVPAADLTTISLPVDAPTVEETQATFDSTTDGGSYVIDPYLIDQDASSSPAAKSPDLGWTNPDESPVPPIDDPFWA